MMPKRTFGWVQNPNVLSTLKNVVGALLAGSSFNRFLIDEKLPLLLKNGLISKDNYKKFIGILSQEDICVKYEDLKGKGGPRGLNSKGLPNSLCTGIIQASIDAQKSLSLVSIANKPIEIKKPYTDDWTADGYVRWGISTGLLEYDNNDDTVRISRLGKALVEADEGSLPEYNAFAAALLSYPPVIRVLSILDDNNYHTKFDIGANLGFSGEMGFTSIPQNYFFAEVCSARTPKEASAIRSNEEGDSDKYARTIARWLQQMGWVETKQIPVHETYAGNDYSLTMNSYHITVKGKRALKLSAGYSSNPKIPKIVYFEMLATKAPDAEYLRGRRARIIEYLAKQNRPRSIGDISNMLDSFDMTTPSSTIADDLDGMKRIGLNIAVNSSGVVLKDLIRNLIIPEEKFESLEITKMKEIVRDKLKVLDHKYLTLIDLAYSDAPSKSSDAREFEIETASLFVDELDFCGMRLGDSGRPDVIIYYDIDGAIIDNKSYKDGFNIDKHCADEMMRYVIQNSNRTPGEPANEWWKNFDPAVTSFKFLFVTSFLKGQYENNIRSIYQNTGVEGGAVSVDNLLYIADDIKNGNLSKQDFFSKIKNTALIA